MREVGNSIAIDVRMASASGIGTFIRNMVPRVVSRRGCDRFVLIGHAENFDVLNVSPSPSIEFRLIHSPIYSVSQQIELPRAMSRSVDIFWSPHYDIPLFVGGKMLVTVHDVAHISQREVFDALSKRIYSRTMFNAVRFRADAIAFMSNFTSCEFESLVGAPRGLSHVVYGGVGPEWYGVEAGPSLRDRPFILYVGNVKPHKNLHRLLLAFDSIKDEISQDLLIVGREEGFLTGDTGIRDLSMLMGKRVDFTGYVDDRTLKRYVAQADAMVLPSLYEGFGLPPLEAMAVGCPVLVSRIASLPEVCGEAALYCDPYSVEDLAMQLRRIVSDQSLRETLRAAGLSRVRQFTWDAAAKEYDRILSSVLSNT